MLSCPEFGEWTKESYLGGLLVAYRDPMDHGEVALEVEDNLHTLSDFAPEIASEPHLSIVIPVYNETKRLSSSVPKLISYFGAQEYTYEFVIVDDGSSDGTPELVRELFAAVKNLR